MIMAIVTRRSDLLIFNTAVSIRRAINMNVVMVSGNDHFLISTVVMMVMRDGRAANTNVVMVPRNNHFLVPIVVVVMVVMVMVG
jgi:hypothetical protein